MIKNQLHLHDKALRRFASSFNISTDQVDDLVQETYLKALQNEEKFDGSNLRSWLFTILKNLHFGNLRNVKRRNTISENVYGSEGESASLLDLIEVAPVQEITLTMGDLQRCIKKLKQAGYQMLEMIAVEGLSYQEVGETFGMCPNTVKSNVHRTRKHLVELMG